MYTQLCEGSRPSLAGPGKADLPSYGRAITWNVASVGSAA